MYYLLVAFVFSLACANIVCQDTVKEPGYLRQGFNAVSSVVKDALIINKNLFHADTFRIAVTTFPFIAASTLFDKRLQGCFHDREIHKNINQFGNACHNSAQYGIMFPVFFAAATSLAARDENLRYTSQIFLIGFPFVLLVKDSIKAWQPKGEWCLRPWHEKFDWHQRASGGFPSGHMALASYAAALYGVRLGYKYAIPLGAYAGFLGVAFINCNRHYLSQIVAGAGFGVIYAYAASKAVDEKLAWLHKNDINIHIDALDNGTPAVNISYRF